MNRSCYLTSWRTPFRAGLTAILCTSALVGCGYRVGLAPAIPRDPLPIEALDSAPRLALEGLGAEAREGSSHQTLSKQTLGIQIFGNESLLPNLERDLHEVFTHAARRHASMRIVDPSRADLFIRGRIANFRRGYGSRTPDNRAVETIELLTIEAELIDGSTGRILGRAQAQPSVGTAIDVPGREVATRERALANAADRLLLLLLAGLEYGVTRPGDPLLPETRGPRTTRQRNLQRELPTNGPSGAPEGTSDAGSAASPAPATGESDK